MCIRKIQLTHISEDLTHKMEGQPSQTEISWVLGMFSHVHVYFYDITCRWLTYENVIYPP